MAVRLMRGLSLYGSIDQVWQTAVPGFLYNRKLHFLLYKKASGRMRTAAYNDDVASDHRRRQNVPRYILYYRRK